MDSSTLFNKEHFNFGPAKQNIPTAVIDSNNTQQSGTSCNKGIFQLKHDNKI